MRRLLWMILLTSLVVWASVSSVAKPAITKILIAPPGQAPVVESTDPRLLLHPRNQTLVERNSVVERPEAVEALPRWEVSFVSTEGGLDRVVYIVDYVVDNTTGQGLVYLPGPGDTRYALNSQTVVSRVADGRWHRASVRWSLAITEILPPVN